MKILICDQQLMLAEALASALDARGYDILAVTTTISDIPGAAGDFVPDVCLLGLQAGSQLDGPGIVRAILQRYPGTKVLVLSEVTAPRDDVPADQERRGGPHPSRSERGPDR